MFLFVLAMRPVVSMLYPRKPGSAGWYRTLMERNAEGGT